MRKFLETYFRVMKSVPMIRIYPQTVNVSLVCSISFLPKRNMWNLPILHVSEETIGGQFFHIPVSDATARSREAYHDITCPFHLRPIAAAVAGVEYGPMDRGSGLEIEYLVVTVINKYLYYRIFGSKNYMWRPFGSQPWGIPVMMSKMILLMHISHLRMPLPLWNL
jgi:hypothetical protein